LARHRRAGRFAHLRRYPHELMNVAIPGVGPWRRIKKNPAILASQCGGHFTRDEPSDAVIAERHRFHRVA
jgi:hypothetical protein